MARAAYISTPRIKRRASAAAGRIFVLGSHGRWRPLSLGLFTSWQFWVAGSFHGAPSPQARSADLGAVDNQINPMELAALYRMLDLLFPLEPLLPLEPELPPPDPEPEPEPEPLDPPELPVEVLAVPADAAVAPLLP